MKIIRAVTSGDIDRAKALFLEYAESLGFDLCFQSFDKELAGLPGEYAAPSGALLLAVEALAERGAVLPGESGEESARGAEDPNGTGPRVAGDGEAAVGCVALRRIDAETCEMKRLYVRPSWRGSGIGRALVEMVIGEARKIGYKRMRLDAIRNMTAAVGLYASMGFQEIAPYRLNPIPGAVYLELSLE